MHGTHDFAFIEFVEYLSARRFVFLVSSGVAVALTFAIGMSLPRRYTAKSSILIEPPRNDAYGPTVLSPAYLESLGSWESFAGSDTLYARVAGRLRVWEPKASVVKITHPPNSMVIGIGVTLRDPVKAQALARDLADATVELSRTVESRGPDDQAGELKKQVEAAQARLTRSSEALMAFAAANPVAAPENEVRSGFDFRLRLKQDLSAARTSLAEAQGNIEAAALQARIRALESQERELAASLEKKGAALDAVRNTRAALEDEQHAARAAYEDLSAKLNDSLASSQTARTRLRIIDAGITPREPSSPDLRLNLIAAFFASIVATLACLMVRFSYVRLERERSEHLYSLR